MSEIKQYGTLKGSISSVGTLEGSISSDGMLTGSISSDGTLAGSISSHGTMSGKMSAQGDLKGTIYMSQGKTIVEGGKQPKIGTATLLASAWVGEDRLYHQVVEIEGVTENSQVDLTPSVEQLLVFYDKDLAFVTENEGGVVTVYAIGQKPANDYTIQVTITEVAV
jgi:hypothetical protein